MYKKEIMTFLKRSSETTRVTPRNLDFIYYLAGLIDGDGSFIVNPQKNSIVVEITLHEEDVATLYFVKKNCGFGLVRKRPNVKAYRYRVAKKEQVYILLKQLQGKLCTLSKQEQFKRALSLFEKVFISYNCNPLKDNSWFAGFVDAEGYFSIRNKNTLCFSISQKDPVILEKCKKLFGVGNIYFDKSWNGYNWAITDLYGITLILKYFSNYPLKTKKRIDFVKFKRLCFFKERGDHLENSLYNQKFNKYIYKFKTRKKI